MQQNKKQNIIYSLILIAYAIFTLVLVFHHEVWRDEAQVWLVARDLDFFGIIKHVRTEGHPLLWYFLVMPLTRIFHGFNAVMSMQILNWLFVVAGVGVFLFKSPFNFFLKISLVLSSGFLYWYPVIARSYCLIPILVFLLASLYKKQKEHPFVYAGLLIALANTHVIMFGFCGALALIFAWQFKDEIKTLFNKDNAKIVYNKIQLVAPLLVFIALLSIVLYLWGSQQENCMVDNKITNVTLPIISKGIIGSKDFFVNIICYLLIIIGFVCFFIQNKKIFFIYFSNIIFQFFIYCFIWDIIIPQRIYTLIIVFLFCLWLIYDKIKSTKIQKVIIILLSLIFLLSSKNGLFLAIKDYQKDYSEGKSTAKFIIENIKPETLIISNCEFSTTAISAYLPKEKKFYHLNKNLYYTYSTWSKKEQKKEFQKIDIKEILIQNKTIWIVTSVMTDLSEIFEIKKYDKEYINGNNKE